MKMTIRNPVKIITSLTLSTLLMMTSGCEQSPTMDEVEKAYETSIQSENAWTALQTFHDYTFDAIYNSFAFSPSEKVKSVIGNKEKHLYIKAIEQGSPEAMRLITESSFSSEDYFLLDDSLRHEDLVYIADMLISRAEKQPELLVYAGDTFDRGALVQKDTLRAISYYERAWINGDKAGGKKLLYQYYYRLSDYQNAYLWAIKLHDEVSINSTENRLSPAQRLHIQALAKDIQLLKVPDSHLQE